MIRRALLVFSLLLVPSIAFAQADQAITASDSPDPVVPGNNITYSLTVTNNGPNAATNGGMQFIVPGGTTVVSLTAPAGFSCLGVGAASGAPAQCTTPSFAPGTANMTVVLNVNSSLRASADGTISTTFLPTGTTPDPVPGNNNATVSTTYDSPESEVSLTVTDSPDPVFPDGNITYTVTVTNAGPQATDTINLNVPMNNTLKFQSVTAPAGWTCPTAPAVGSGASFHCTSPSMPVGTAQFTVVLQADDAAFGITDQTIVQNFNVGAANYDPNPNNQSVNVSTQYQTPDADIQLTATDSPDPVFPDGDITYTVTVTNAGPNTPTTTNLNVPMNNTLRFQSIVIPAGWNCPNLPAVGAGTSFTCTNPSFGPGSSQFTIVLKADDAAFGIQDQTIVQNFNANGNIQDPNPNNQSVNVSTQYTTPDADIQITATDSPDPVFPDGDITYTVTVTNAGPDTAPNVNLNVPMNNTLRFQSITIPAGWNCPNLPAVGGGTSFTCSNPSLAVGSSQFTIVLKAEDSVFGINDTTIVQHFGANSAVQDPNNANNGVNVSTQYSTPDADMAVTATDAPDPVVAGNNITYSGTVTNGGPDAAPNTILHIALHPSLLYQSITQPSGFNCTAPQVGATGLITCTNPSMAPGSANFSVVAQVNPALLANADGSVQTTFTVSSNVQDAVNTNNQVTVATQFTTPDADLSITDADTPDPVLPGGTITYTANLLNNGPSAATNTVFTETLSPSVGFQSISAPAGFNCTTPAIGATGTITCTHPSLPNGAGGTFTTTVNVLATSGTIGNNVSVSTGADDPDPTDDQASTTTTILAATTADLSITKATNSTSVAPGFPVTYTITVTNNGPDVANLVNVTDNLPPSLLFQSIAAPAGFTCTTPAVGATGTINCSAASMPVGTVQFTLNTTVAPGASGTINNTASATSSASNDPNAGNSNGSAPGIVVNPAVSDLGITKTTPTTSAAPGGTIVYTITATNAGPDVATNVVVTDTLPSSLLYQSIAFPAGFNCVAPAVGATGTITCTAATMPVGNAVFTLTTRVAPGAAGTITNSANVTTSASDPNNANNTGSTPAITVTGASADLAISKTTASTNAIAGTTLNYTITLTNNGPSTATNVIMTDVLPPQLLFVNIVTPAGFTCTTPAVGANGTVTCTGASMASGATAQFTLVTQVDPSATGSISNSASVVSSVGDPNSGNSSSTAPPVVVFGAADADVSIVKSTAAVSAQTGTNITYTMTVSNAGPVAATNVIVTDTLPAGVTLVSAPGCTGTTTITCNVGTLNAGANTTINLTVAVTATSGTITNTASVDADQNDPNGGNNTSTTAPVPVVPAGPGEVVAVPTLSEWALIAMAMRLGLAALLKMR